MIQLLKSKIHKAVVTGADLNYEGSISICPNLLFMSGILENEQVHVWNVTNGYRMVTYALTSKNEKEICINGAGAHHNQPGDVVIIAAFKFVSEEYAELHKPRIIICNNDNRIKEMKGVV
jgi:aspartate 1-decarboxylase